VKESRSNILWQVIAGVLDRQPDFAATYMALALDNALSDEDYAHEIRQLHKDWAHYLKDAGALRDHKHGSGMRSVYHSIACPACNILTALAVRDPGMRAVFEEMRSLAPQERRELLAAKGLLPFLKIVIPGPAPGL
jgi:hypothetical protein